MRGIKEKLNLCDSCEYCLATCNSWEEGVDFLFGTGAGFDNVWRCNNYRRKQITLEEYLESCLRTAQLENQTQTEAIMNCALGLCGEAGELADHVKKYVFQGHELSTSYMKKELGDIMWYVVVLAKVLGVSMDDVLQTNVEKLYARYPDGFSKERSVNRAE